MREESWEKVASKCASCGEAASRRSGGEYDMVCWAAVGETLPGLVAAKYVSSFVILYRNIGLEVHLASVPFSDGS